MAFLSFYGGKLGSGVPVRLWSICLGDRPKPSPLFFGNNSAVECRTPNPEVPGSNPGSRSICSLAKAQAKAIYGEGAVVSSTTRIKGAIQDQLAAPTPPFKIKPALVWAGFYLYFRIKLFPNPAHLSYIHLLFS